MGRRLNWSGEAVGAFEGWDLCMGWVSGRQKMMTAMERS